MAEYTSSLTLKLIDGVTEPARKMEGSLSKLAGGAKLFVEIFAGKEAINFTREAVKSFAELERRLDRIAVLAHASRGETQGAAEEIHKIATDTALSLDDVVKGLEALVQRGKSLQESMDLLPTIARAAQAGNLAADQVAAAWSTVAT